MVYCKNIQLKQAVDSIILRRLTRISHEFTAIHLVACMIAGIVAFMGKDSLYPTRRVPNANAF